MGAYENPKSYIIDYSAGVKSFTDTFNKGIASGVAMGNQLIAEREAYEEDIYTQGQEMEKELSAAVGNTKKTKDQINQAFLSIKEKI